LQRIFLPVEETSNERQHRTAGADSSYCPGLLAGTGDYQTNLVTILVHDQEEALRWFTEILGLKKL
jgi:hypothetical protein